MTGGLPFAEPGKAISGGQGTERGTQNHGGLVVRCREEVGEYECADCGGDQEDDVTVAFHTIGTPARGRTAKSFP